MWENEGMSYVEDALLAMTRHGQSMHEAGVVILGSVDLVSNVSLSTLVLLHSDGPQRPTRIAELTGLTSGGATKLITRLETAGLVAREAGTVPADGRAIVVSLTEVGSEKMGKVMAAVAPYVDALLDALHAIGGAERPALPLNLVGDNGGGAMYLVAGVLAALHDRERSGGVVVHAAMVEGAASLMAPFYEMAAAGLWEDHREVNLLDGGAPFYTTYQTSDGKWMAVGPLEPHFYAEMLNGLNIDPAELPGQYDRDRWPELRSRLAGAFAERTRAEWEDVFTGTDACVTPVLSLSEAPEHPHNLARRVFSGSAGHHLPNPTPRIDGRDPSPLADAPEIGIDTGEILTRLGYDNARIQALRDLGTVS